MNDVALYQSTIPVFTHYVGTIDALLQKLPENSLALNGKLATHAFSAAEHIETALGFVSRTVLPLIGQQQAEPQNDVVEQSYEMLRQFAKEVSALLATVAPADFQGAANRVIQHTAGSAKLEHNATDFVTLFSLPNFFFHYATAFAIFRLEGVNIGKADFDGLHVYAAGFNF